ncbi:dTDP-4-dehydrorhamnose reductase [Cellulomonas sp. P5_E12]
MRWLVTGSNGMLGKDLVALLGARSDDEVTAADRATLDVTDPVAVDTLVAGHGVVVNCAAWTAVDDAETSEGRAFDVNGTGAAHLARAADRHGARIVQVSTDYVFDGRASSPYREDAPVGPRSAYGRTKVAGEWAVRSLAANHLVVRTAWLYGEHGPCFPKTVLRVVRERGGIDVVDDQIGQPTWTADLADLVVRLVDGDATPGTYHGTSSGSVSWWGFAREVVAAAGLDPELVRTTPSDAFVRPAPRPSYSVLGHDAFRETDVAPIGRWDERWRVAAPAMV